MCDEQHNILVHVYVFVTQSSVPYVGNLDINLSSYIVSEQVLISLVQQLQYT